MSSPGEQITTPSGVARSSPETRIGPSAPALMGLVLAVAALALFVWACAAYGASPPSWTAPPWAPPTWAPALSPAPATVGAGIVQGHVYAYDGSPVAEAMVIAAVMDAQGEPIWYQQAVTGTDGLYLIGGAPATTSGELWVMTPDETMYVQKRLVFADPGTSSYDVWPGKVTWSVAREGPLKSQWQDLVVEAAGLSTTGAPVYVNAYLTGLAFEDPIVTGWAPALPEDVRCLTVRFRDNELAVWDAADPGHAALPLTAGATTALPGEIHEGSAFRVLVTRPYWRSGKPGTIVRLALENFPAGLTLRLSGEGPNVSTTWGDKTCTSTGPERQSVSLAVPARAWPGYTCWMVAEDPVIRYQTIYVGLADAFQVCTLKATKPSVSRGSSVKLSGVVPVEGHERTYPGKPKYVWIYRRTTARSQPPTAWDATTKGWKLVARVRTDGLGRYHSALLKPTRTTWYVARYAGDEQYFRAYTSVLKVRVD